MGFIKKIINYFKKNKQIKVTNTPTNSNFITLNNTHKTIVFISCAIPTHDKDSGSNRLLEIILAFKKLNYNCLICVENVFENDNYVQFYKQLGIIVYTESNQFKNLFEFLKSIKSIDYIWYNGPNTLKKYQTKLSKMLPSAKSFFDMIDIHFLRYQRAIELEPNRISLKIRYNKYFKIETQLAKKVDIVVAISEREKKIMHKYLPDSNIITISNIHYSKVKKNSIPAFEERKDILFIGSAHSPNIDAIVYLYNEILPLVWKKLPNIKVKIIGNVDKEITTINNPNIDFLGYVENVIPHFLNSKLMVAPLRYGAGVKGKVGQAFEYYLPVITTSIGAEGMKIEHQENALVEDTPEGFAQSIIKLYTDKDLWTKLQNNSEESLLPFSKERLNKTISEL